MNWLLDLNNLNNYINWILLKLVVKSFEDYNLLYTFLIVGLELGKNIMKNHRFQGGETALSEAGSPIKKSSPPSNQPQHVNP